jgi:hypothetical protein
LVVTGKRIDLDCPALGGGIFNKHATMPYLAERLRQLGLKCSRLARDHRENNLSVELEGLAVELAEEASKLDRPSSVIEET